MKIKTSQLTEPCRNLRNKLLLLMPSLGIKKLSVSANVHILFLIIFFSGKM